MNIDALPRLNLPEAPLRLDRGADGAPRVFDPLRCKWVALTPEEHVRQAFTSWLVLHCGYPSALMANEVGITLNGMSRRCDTVVYSRSRRPLAIVEYKSPSVAVTRRVFDQIVRYNMVLQVPCLMVSNGLVHYCCRVCYAEHRVEFLPGIPSHAELSASL